MHGYHPDDPHSFAALCTNQESVPDDITAIPDLYRLMTRDAEMAHARNRPGRVPGRAAGVTPPSGTPLPSREPAMHPLNGTSVA